MKKTKSPPQSQDLAEISGIRWMQRERKYRTITEKLTELALALAMCAMELSIAFRNYRYKFLKLLTTFWKLSLVFWKISDNF